MIILVSFLVGLKSFAQEKKVNRENQQWIQYYTQLKFNDKWTLFTDGGFRWKNDLENSSQYIVRTGIYYKLNSSMAVGAGFAHLGFYDNSGKINRVEFRPYQEFNMSTIYKPVTIQHRFRLEERFFNPVVDDKIKSGSDFNFRFRYRLLFTVPVFKLSSTDPTKNVALSVGDEIMINAGKEIVSNVFDQNRLLIGTIVTLDKNFSASLTYNNQFASTKTVGTYNQANIIWLGVTQKINISKSK
ncbi:DUF2490 domain-containing protein [Halpernia frigidisoli]|nr:DUF2490 domain-containing protein [Halpernia frigidisoli]